MDRSIGGKVVAHVCCEHHRFYDKRQGDGRKIGENKEIIPKGIIRIIFPERHPCNVICIHFTILSLITSSKHHWFSSKYRSLLLPTYFSSIHTNLHNFHPTSCTWHLQSTKQRYHQPFMLSKKKLSQLFSR